MPTDTTPLLTDQDSVQSTAVQAAGEQVAVKKQTPLPKLQLFAMLLVDFAEPVVATVIYPFVVSLVNETGTLHPCCCFLTHYINRSLLSGITGGDQAKTGYYAGIIASRFSETLFRFVKLCCFFSGIRVLCIRGLDCFRVGPCIRCHWQKNPASFWHALPDRGHCVFWLVQQVLATCDLPLYPRHHERKYRNHQKRDNRYDRLY